QRPRLLHPTPRLRSQPPVLPTPSSRQPGSQRSARPRSPCVLRGRWRGEAASAAGEVGAEAHRGAEARREETWREGRSLDSGGRAHQAPGTERRGTGDLWPSMHRVPSPTAEQPAGRGDNTRRTPQPRLKASAPTMALPRTLGELQLYRVLQRANLLSYYETFIQQGGDDVQQLCEAGEEEFLEIMALVGMATKPLHVRRLQKALREWATNPGLFSQPVPAVPVSSIPLFKISETAGTRKGSMSNGHGSPGEKAGSARSFSPKSPLELGEKLSPLPGGPGTGDPRIWPGQSTPESDVGAGGEEEAGSPPFSPPAGGGVPEGTGAGGMAAGGTGGGPDRLEPEMVRMVVESVERIFRSFPRGDAGEVTSLLKLNKKLARSVGHIFEMDDNDSQKEEEIRKYSIIYGRLDSKRREGKQLSLHELTINEAAAQFCMRDNTLLLRRVELFSLSRQVARESTYLSSLKGSRLHSEELGGPPLKKLKQEVGEQSHTEIQPPPGPESYAPPYRPSLEEDSASLSGESLDGHLQEFEEGLLDRCPAPGPHPALVEGRRSSVKVEAEASRQ
ncbi:NGFI-A-binding protein 2, partial [Lemmus lemmus]